MIFCPKCGSLLRPNKENRKIVICGCGYKSKSEGLGKIKEEVKQKKNVEVVDKDIETLPLMDAECPKCSHRKAYYHLVQTRAADEPETKFLRCEKCRHRWRDYD